MSDLAAIPGVRRATQQAWEETPGFSLGAPEIDAALGGGLAKAALHEVLARSVGDAASATGFTLSLAMRATGGEVLWARHGLAAMESGIPYGPGLVELGLDPNRLVLIAAPDALSILRAAHDALRAGAFGAVLVELWSAVRALDLTATRRLAMAAEEAGSTALLLRSATEPGPNAATTRWRIAAAPSLLMEAGAPGQPVFEAELLRHRGGAQPQTWRLEWNREERAFSRPTPLSGSVVSLPARRPVPAMARPGEFRRTG